MKRTVVSIEISTADYTTIMEALKHWAYWLEDSESPWDAEQMKRLLQAKKAMQDSAEVIDYE